MRKFMEGYILAEKDDINAKITEDSSPDDATIAVIILEITKLKI